MACFLEATGLLELVNMGTGATQKCRGGEWLIHHGHILSNGVND